MSEPTIMTTIQAPSAAPDTAVEEVPAVAEEAPAPETAEAPAPEDPKEDPDLVYAQRLESVARREAKTRKIEAQLQEMKSSLASKEAELSKKMAEFEVFMTDPVAWAMKNGKDPVEIVQRATKPQSEEAKELAELRKRIDEREKLEKERETKEEEARRVASERQSWARFVSEITPEEYPHLTAMHEASEIPGLVVSMMNAPHDPTDPESPSVRDVFRSQYRRDPTPKEIREALETQAEIRAKALVSRLTPKQTTTPESPETPPTPKAKSGSPSISSQHATSSPSTSAGTESREERMKRLKEELEAEQARSE